MLSHPRATMVALLHRSDGTREEHDMARSAANQAYAQQKSRLTRAVNSGDAGKVEAECRRTVNEWAQAPFNGAWPDDWSRWQRALDDSVRWPQQAPRLDDL